MLAGLVFSNLWGLLLLFGAVPIVYAYFRKKNYLNYQVSSLFFFKNLEKKKIIKKKFKPPLRFYFEILSLIFLAIGASIPFYDAPGKKIAILFDNSLSMQVVSNGKSRIDEAKEEFKKWLDKNKTSDIKDISIYLTSPKFRLETNDLLINSLLKKINELQAENSAGNVLTAASKIIEEEKYDKIIILTDNLANYTASEVSSSKNKNKKADIEVITVGKVENNFYYSQISYLQESQEIILNIGKSEANEIAKDANIKLAVYGLDNALNKKEIIYTEQLESNRIWPKIINISTNEKKYEKYFAELVTTSSDSLKADNSAFILINKDDVVKILLVSQNESVASDAMGLKLIPGVVTVVITPEEYELLTNDDIEKFSLIIFHGAGSKKFPSVNALYILPPNGLPFCSVKQTISAPRISSWKETHSVLTYLNLSLLKPQNTLVFYENVGQSLISSEKGPILISGELNRHRYICSGFELLPFEGKETPTMSVLTLNILSWISMKPINDELITGKDLILSDNDNYELKTPSSKIIKLSDNNFSFKESGFYSLVNLDKKTTRSFSVNIIHQQESETAKKEVVTLPASINYAKTNTSSARPLWSFLAYAVLLCICLDMLFSLSKGRNR